MNLLILVSIWFPVCFVALCILGYFLYNSLTSNKSTSRTPEEDDHSAIKEVENILGETVVKNPGEGIVIGSDGIDTVTANAVPITMRKLYQINRRKMQGLEEKIYAFLREGECRVFKNDDQEREEHKRSINECAQTCKDLQKINDLMIQAANAGIFICHVIVVITSLMSPDKEKELGAKVHAFEGTMTLVNTGEFSVAVSRILDTLQEAKIQLRRKKDSEKTDMEMAARASKGKNVITEEEVKIHREAEIHCVDDGRRSMSLDPIMFLLRKLIFKAELFWVYKRLSSTDSLLIEELPLLEHGSTRTALSVFEVELLIVHSAEEGKFGAVSEGWKENPYHTETEWKINEVWHGLKQ